MAVEIMKGKHLKEMTRQMNEEDEKIQITYLKTEEPKAAREYLDQDLRQVLQRREAAGRRNEGTVKAAASPC
eukprot:818912-Heterocapsa_arctica.AAC.1